MKKEINDPKELYNAWKKMRLNPFGVAEPKLRSKTLAFLQQHLSEKEPLLHEIQACLNKLRDVDFDPFEVGSREEEAKWNDAHQALLKALYTLAEEN